VNNPKNRIEIRGFAAEAKCDKLQWHKKANGAPWLANVRRTSEPVIHFPSTNSSETYITILIPLISGNGEKPTAHLPDAAV